MWTTVVRKRPRKGQGEEVTGGAYAITMLDTARARGWQTKGKGGQDVRVCECERDTDRWGGETKGVGTR